MRARPPDVAVRTVVGLAVCLVIMAGVITLGRTLPDPPIWLVTVGLPLAVGFDAFCLADIAGAARVRYLPKWAWALICLIQTPRRRHHVPEHRPYRPDTASAVRRREAMIELNGLTKRSGPVAPELRRANE